MTADSTPADRLQIDFIGGAVGYRRMQGQGRSQPLPKAVGMAKGHLPQVVDATAGMGRDSFVLATLGAQVTMIERNRAVHTALEEALARARGHNDELAAIVGRMTLLYGDAKDLLPELAPEVVLVDPMHPDRTKSALVKKEMRIMRDTVGADTDSAALMQAAFASATGRVVLKWPLRAASIEGIRNPSYQIMGKTIRYDVFVIG